MTELASVAAGDMVERFTAGHCAIVTIDTRADHFVVIDIGRNNRGEQTGRFCMTGLTGVAAVDMSDFLAGGDDAVVAANAIIDNRRVIDAGP